MSIKARAGVVTVAVLTAMGASVSASADTVTGQGTLAKNMYRGGAASRGGVYVSLGVQVARDSAGQGTNVRGAGRITKISRAAKVQVDRVAPDTCIDYRVRANYSVRWTDNGLSTFSLLSPLARVCGSSAAPVYPNCAAMNATFPHGVGRPGAVDHTSGVPVTDFYVNADIYNANAAGRDADHDGIACEKH